MGRPRWLIVIACCCDSFVVIGLVPWNGEGPIALFVRAEGDGIVAHPVAAILIDFSVDVVSPAFEVEPVEAFAPKLDSTINGAVLRGCEESA